MGVYHEYKLDGSIEKYNVRLVGKGFSQMHGIYYLEAFAPIVKDC